MPTASAIAMPLPPDWVLAGDPAPVGQVLVTSPDGRQVAGTWECGAGTFRYHHRAAETIRIDAGHVTIRSGDGEAVTLSVGAMAHFPQDSVSVWHVDAYVRKTFFLVKPAAAQS